jgi:hypothetical protein
MPLHKRTSTEWNSACNDLQRDLERELTTPQKTGEPIIIEDETPQTKSMRVYVIWDRWKECGVDVRSEIIIAAYGRVRGEDVQQSITLAAGLVPADAVQMGLLPYQVLPVRKKGESPTEEEYREAMLKAGARRFFGTSPELRFASYEDAEACYESLQRALPGSKWVIGQEMTPAEM